MTDAMRQEITVENIPAALKSGRHWLCWRRELVRERWTKVPYRPFGPPRKAKTNDPGTWGSFDQAYAYWRAHPELSGIGIVFTGELVGVDLDHCLAGETIQPWASAILAQLDTYSERSPSGGGIHALAWGSLPDGRRSVPLPQWGANCRLEMYDGRSPRYFTVSGAVVGEYRTTERRTEALAALHGRYLGAPGLPVTSGARRSPLSDEAILARLGQAANAAKFARVFGGDLADYGGDHSRADLALCGMLARYSDDPAQIDRLFRRSALLRPKWDERHGRANRTYADLTIQRALAADRPRNGRDGGNGHLPEGRWGPGSAISPPGPAQGPETGGATTVPVRGRQLARRARVPRGERDANGREPAGDAGPPDEFVSPDERFEDDAEREDLTDLGNARRLVRLHGQDLRHVAGWGWLCWSGQRWLRDEKHVMRCAKATALGFYRDAAELLRAAQQQAAAYRDAGARSDRLTEREALEAMHRLKDRTGVLAGWAKASQSRSRLEAMVKLAESEPAVTAAPEDFDAEPWRFNCANGTVDLRTGALGLHRREDRLTRLAPVPFEPEAPCPTFTAFLGRIMEQKPELIQFMQRLVGYALTGSVREQMLFFLYGSGANGKSTLLNILLALLGEDYARQAAPDVLTVGRDRHPTELADLAGVRLVASIEVAEGKQLAEALVKQLTGGDKIKARFMRQDFFEFAPTFKIFLAANHKPMIRGTDHAIWRRIKLIPFAVTIPEEEQDKELLSKLRAELPGILAWAVRGCLAWQAEGLAVPEDVRQATAAYRDESDLLAGFLTECTRQGAKLNAQAGPLYKAYRAWAAGNGLAEREMLSTVRFARQLVERGYAREVDKGSHRTHYKGLELITNDASSSSGREGISGSA
jgi:putative DNA primase/helicase